MGCAFPTRKCVELEHVLICSRVCGCRVSGHNPLRNHRGYILHELGEFGRRSCKYKFPFLIIPSNIDLPLEPQHFGYQRSLKALNNNLNDNWSERPSGYEPMKFRWQDHYEKE